MHSKAIDKLNTHFYNYEVFILVNHTNQMNKRTNKKHDRQWKKREMAD